MHLTESELLLLSLLNSGSKLGIADIAEETGLGLPTVQKATEHLVGLQHHLEWPRIPSKRGARSRSEARQFCRQVALGYCHSGYRGRRNGILRCLACRQKTIDHPYRAEAPRTEGS
jgi:hypothetical protein